MRFFTLSLLCLVTSLSFSQSYFKDLSYDVNATSPLLSQPSYLVKNIGSGDFNEDGFNDIAFLGEFIQFTLSVQFGRCDGLLTDDPDTIPTPFSNRLVQLHVSDVNMDNHDDIILSAGNIILVYPGDGHGNFANPVSTIVPGISTSIDKTDFSIADFNHDTYPDIFISVYHYNPGGMQTSMVLQGVGNSTFTAVPQNFYPGGSNYVPNDVADVNNDGWMDVVISTGVFLNNNGLLDTMYVTGYSTGAFNPSIIKKIIVRQMDADPATEYFAIGDTVILYGEINTTAPIAAQAYTFPASVVGFDAGDLNGDAVADVIITHQNANARYYRIAASGLVAVTPPVPAIIPGNVLITDIDNDGDNDFFNSKLEQTYINLGNYRFYSSRDIPIVAPVRDVYGADLDNDGYGDFIVCSNTITLVFGRECGIKYITQLGGSSVPLEARTGYFNNDSLPDIAVSSEWSANIYIYLNNGGGTFAPVQVNAVAYNENELCVHDFNEDGYDDIYLLVNPGGTIGVRYQMLLADPAGSGTFLPATAIANPAIAANVYAHAPEKADFNKDGHMDVIISHDVAFGQGRTINWGDGMGGFTKTGYPSGFAYVHNVPMTLDADTFPDIVTSGGALDNDTRFFCRNSATATPLSCLPDFTVGPHELRVLDINNDSINDLLLLKPNLQSFGSLYIMKPDFTFQYVQPNFPCNEANSANADFNGDGNTDLAFITTNGLYITGNGLPTGGSISLVNDTLIVTPVRTTSTPLSYEWFKDHVLIPGATQNFLPVTSNGVYEVGMTYPNQAYVTARYTVSTITGIDEITNRKFLVYPNPASSDVKIQFQDKNNSGVLIHVTDISGKKIQSLELPSGVQEAHIDLSGQSAGVYFIIATAGDYVYSSKLVKE